MKFKMKYYIRLSENWGYIGCGTRNFLDHGANLDHDEERIQGRTGGQSGD